MSITDELRDWAHGFTEPYKRNEHQLLAIADRIDAEHERQCAESWMRGHDAWAAIDRSDEMAEHGWIRLPKDADGVPIRVGDKMDFLGHMTMDATDGHNVFFFADNWADGVYCEDAALLRHYHEPTIEDVLWDMLDSLDLDPTSHVDTGAVIAEYAAKLRLAGDAE